MKRREAIKGIGLITGCVISPSMVSGLLAGCNRAYNSDCILQTLNKEQNRMVVILSELIIPATDTPGARAAKVNQFIDLMLTKWFQEDEKKIFLTGLEQLDERAQASFGTPFLEISAENQRALLKELEKESEAAGGDPFFTLLKELTITGYYTSEIGASQELKYVHVAGRYDGDVPYSEIGKAYS